MSVFKNKFEKHAVFIVCMPFFGLLVERIPYWLEIYEGTFYNIFSGICTALWLGAILWGAINVYFICARKNNWARKLLWGIVSLIPALYTIGLLLWIEFDML